MFLSWDQNGYMIALYFFSYKTEVLLPKQSQISTSILEGGSRSFGLFWKG